MREAEEARSSSEEGGSDLDMPIGIHDVVEIRGPHGATRIERSEGVVKSELNVNARYQIGRQAGQR